MKNRKTKLTFEYDGQNYTLEFTPDSLKQMERGGFNFSRMQDAILTAPEELFYGAFIANHRRTTRSLREEIWKAMTDTDEEGNYLSDIIGEMMSEAINELNSHQGNVKWSVER